MKKLKFLVTTFLLTTLAIGNVCGTGAITISSEILIPKGSSSYSAGDWSKAGSLTSYSSSETDKNIGSFGSISFMNAADYNNADGLQCKASGGYIKTVITSTAGVDIQIVCSGTNGFQIELTGASTLSSKTGTVDISTTETVATLKITKNTSNAGYIKTIKITPKEADCTQPAQELTVTPANISVGVDGQAQLSLTVGTGNGATLVYSSENEDVATVTSDGLVTGVKKGTTKIIVEQEANTIDDVEYCAQKFEVPVSVLAASYTITWQGPLGTTTSKVEQGEALGTLGAAVASCDPENYPEFIGWSATNIGKNPVNEVTLIDEAIIPEGNTTYYAVFANEKPVVDGYTLVTDINDLTIGDSIVIGASSKNKVASAYDGAKKLTEVDGIFENGRVTTSGEMRLAFGGEVGAYTFTNSAGKKIGASAVKTMTLGTGTTTWTITFSGNNAIIKNTQTSYGSIKYNSDLHGFNTYTSTGQTDIQIYKYSKGNLEDLEFISQCCDAWTNAPTISYDNYNLDSDDELAKTSAAPTVVFPDGMEDYAGTLTFESSNIAVATVNSDGVVTAIGSGKCVIRAIWRGDSKYCDMTIASDTFHVAGKFSVAYNPNAEGVTGEMEAKQYLGDTKIGLDTCKFVRTGYHFIGWAASSDGQKMYNDGDSLVIISTMNLFAVWEINNYAVTKGAETNGTFSLSAETVDHGGEIIVTKTPDKYYKNGTVVISPAENGEVSGDTIKNITGAIEVTVNFEETPKYTITWHSSNGETEVTHVHEGYDLADEGGVPAPKGSCSGEHTNFYGWTKEQYGNMGEPKAVAPSEIIKANFKPEANCDFYSVYSNGVIGGGEKMTQLAIGDQVVIIANDSVELSGLTEKQNSTSTAYFGSVAKYNGTPNATFVLEVVEGASNGTFAFKHGEEYLNVPSDNNYMYKSTEVNNYSSWSVAFDQQDSTVTLNNKGYTSRYLKFNPNSGDPRFAAYKSTSSSTFKVSLYSARPSATEYISACCEYLPFEVANDTILFETDGEKDLSELVTGEGNKGEFHYAMAEDYRGVELTGSLARFEEFGTYRFIISQDAKFGGEVDTCGVIKELFVHTANLSCIISYDKNNENAVGEMNDETDVDTYSQHVLSANTFISSSHHFVCWNTKADGTGDSIADKATIIARDITLYAQWEINKYAVSISSSIEHGTIEVNTGEIEHGGEVTVTPIADFGYKFKRLTVEPVENCSIQGNKATEIVGAITLGAEFEEIPVYTIKYRDAETDSITSELVEEGQHLNPDLTKFGCARMPLVGFSATAVADSSKTYTAINLETYTVTSDATLWAVYTLNKGESGEFNPSRTKSGDFKVSAIVEGVEYFAADWTGGASAVGKYGYSTDESEAKTLTFTQISEGVYTIKQGAKYIVVNKVGGTDLAKRDTVARWRITPSNNGSWRVVNEASNRALMYRYSATNTTSAYNVFGAYANAAGGEYFDVEIGHNNASIYSSTPLCNFVDVTGISLDKTSEVIRNCDNEGKLQLTATVLPADATIPDVIWTSSNTAVATVDANGLVTMVSNGNATITATTKDEGKTATCKVYTRYCVSDVELNKTSLEFLTCENTTGANLTATVSPSNAYEKGVTWESSNTDVATVSTSGYVKVIGVGEAAITVRTTDGDYTATCFVKVRECVLAQEIRLNKDSLHFLICEGNTEQLTATIVPDSVDITKITWSTSNNKIAKVNASGVVTPVAIGTAKITASATDGSGVKAQCVVVIEDCESAVELVSISNHIFTREGMVVIENANAEDVYIYNAVGQMVANKAHVTDLQVTLPAGAYVVRLGNTMTKVIVK